MDNQDDSQDPSQTNPGLWEYVKQKLANGGYDSEGTNTEAQVAKQSANYLGDHPQSDAITPTINPLELAIPADMLAGTSAKVLDAGVGIAQRVGDSMGEYGSATMGALRNMAEPSGELSGALSSGNFPMNANSFQGAMSKNVSPKWLTSTAAREAPIVGSTAEETIPSIAQPTTQDIMTKGGATDGSDSPYTMDQIRMAMQKAGRNR